MASINPKNTEEYLSIIKQLEAESVIPRTSSDIHTLLSAIRANAIEIDMILDDSDSKVLIRELLQHIIEHGLEITGIVNALLIYSNESDRNSKE